MKLEGKPWPRYHLLGLTVEQDDYLYTLGMARRRALKETIPGRVGKPDRSAVVRALITAAMDGRPSGTGPELPMPSAAALLAASTEPPPPVMVSLMDLRPSMARDLRAIDIPETLAMLHELLAAVWARAQRERLTIAEAVPQIAARPRWIGGEVAQ